MNFKNLIFFATGLSLIALLFYQWESSHQWKEQGDPTMIDRIIPDRSDWKLQKRDTSSNDKKQRELKSLSQMSAILFQFANPEVGLNQLISQLEKQKLSPHVTPDSNPYTGNMYIVRTHRPLPGTRYFHAQYFSNPNQQAFVQHMSFQYRPSKNAMQDAAQALSKAFGGLGKPHAQETDLIEWRWKQNYILWIKRLKSEDLKNDPFNAYEKDDVGTIQVALELDLTDDVAHSH